MWKDVATIIDATNCEKSVTRYTRRRINRGGLMQLTRMVNESTMAFLEQDGEWFAQSIERA